MEPTDRLLLCPQEVCTLLLAAHLLGDQISLLNWLGFALCLSGISLHVALKALPSRGDHLPRDPSAPLIHVPALPGRGRIPSLPTAVPVCTGQPPLRWLVL